MLIPFQKTSWIGAENGPDGKEIQLYDEYVHVRVVHCTNIHAQIASTCAVGSYHSFSPVASLMEREMSG